MKKLLAKRRDPASRLGVEHLEGRALLSATPAGTLLVQLTPAADRGLADRLAAAGGATAAATGVPGLVAVSADAGGLARVAALAAADPGVAYVEPQRVERLTATPNDPEYAAGKLWGLNGPSGINAPAAWAVTTGSTAVTIADIDTGADYDHPDLDRNIWINQAEIPASRMKDLTDVDHDGVITFADLNNPVNIGPGKITDVNGDGVIDAGDLLAPMVKGASGNDTGAGGWGDPTNVQDGDTAHPDDLIGWNFVNNTNDPLDEVGHGTETAGVMAATGNNGTGIVGVAWTARVMALKVIDSAGNATDSAAAAAMLYAARHGARVANASFGAYGASQVLHDAVAAAGAAGMVVVAAAGNDGVNTDGEPFFPASFGLPTEVSVAAIDATGRLAASSNYGPATVDLAAPGTGIETTLREGNYGLVSGTSVATPFVTGTVALVAALHPNWTAAQLVRQVLATAAPDPALAGKTVTGAVVNAAAAVGPAAIATTPTITWPNPADVAYGTPLSAAQLNATATAFGVPVAGHFSYSPAPGTVLRAGAGQTLTVTFTPDDPTDYNPATTAATINVGKATPVITWPTPDDIIYGTALGPNQFDATATYPGGAVAGTFAYAPGPGTFLHAGAGQPLTATFTPADTADFNTAVGTTTLNVLKATPALAWTPPAPITYGTPLGPNQLDAVPPVAGSIVYAPAAGVVLGAGRQTLTATFTPADAADYNAVTAGTTLDVTKAHLVVLAGNNVSRYGSAVPPLTYALAGFINGDTAAVVSGSASLSTPATPASGVGSYPIAVGVGTLAAANYDFSTLIPGTLTVTKAFLTVTATNTSRIKGVANPPLTCALTGFVKGDGPGVVSGAAALSTTATASSPVGGYPIAVGLGTLSAANYAFPSLVAGTLTVRPASASRVGDYDGDGKTDLAVVRPATDQWLIRYSSGGGRLDQFGDPTQHDIPVPGDYEGIGRADLAVFRPATDQWIIRLASGAVRFDQFGDPTQHDIPVPGDYEGIGVSDLAVFRPATDQWLVRLSTGKLQIDQFGDPTQRDIPVPGDYDGDSKTDLAVFRPATDQWLIQYSAGGGLVTQFGDPTQRDIPVPGDYDGDGKTDPAVFRPATATWLIRYSSGGARSTQYGDPTAGDLPAGWPLAAPTKPKSPVIKAAAVARPAAIAPATTSKPLARVVQSLPEKTRT